MPLARHHRATTARGGHRPAPEARSGYGNGGKPGTTSSRATPKRVGLFVTCLVDLMRPSDRVCGRQAARGCGLHGRRAEPDLLRPAGLQFGRSGDGARAGAAEHRAFRGFDYVVVPSGSCGGMVDQALSRAASPTTRASAREAEAFAAKTYELVSFLTDVLGVAARRCGLRRHRHLSRFLFGPARARHQERSRASCSQTVRGLDLVEMTDADVCCGFGGTFAVKYGELSNCDRRAQGRPDRRERAPARWWRATSAA